jgi:hypothetical protein
MRDAIAAFDSGVLREATLTSPAPPIDPMAIEILADLDASAPTLETKPERKRRRIEALLECAFACHGVGDVQRAMVAVELALAEDPGSELTRELITRHRSTVTAVFEAFLAEKNSSVEDISGTETRPELSRYRQLWRLLH